MSNDTVQELELNIKRSKEIAELGSALVRLESNRDFRSLIKVGYLEKEAIRLVHLKADPSMQVPARQESIDKQIDAIGGLLEYFRVVMFNAQIALKAIGADEETRDEILAEVLA